MGKKEKDGPEVLESGFGRKLESLCDRRFYPLLSAILLMALAVRILALLSLKGSPYFDFLLWDERLYHVWAGKIVDGTFKASHVYPFSPLPAYFIAFIYKVLGKDILLIRVTNIILGVLTCHLVYLIGKELSGRMVGLISCLVAALYEPFIFYSIVPLKTCLSVFLFALTTYLFLSVMNRHSMTKVALLGGAIGLLINVRPNFAVIFPVMPLFILWNLYSSRSRVRVHAQTLLLYVLGMYVSLSPFLIRNYMVAGRLALTTPQTGINLYMSNKVPRPGPAPFAITSPFEQSTQYVIEASRRVGRKLSQREASNYWRDEVIKIALEHPLTFIQRLFLKGLVFFNRAEQGDHYHIGFVSDFVKFFKLPLMTFWMVLPLGMAGMITRLWKDRKSLALAAVFFLYGSTLVAFFTTTRLRIPMVIILIPFAVKGLYDLLSHVKNKRRKGISIYGAVAAVFIVVEFIPVWGTRDMTAYYNTHAIVINAAGRTQEAIQYWERSSEMDGRYSDFADLALASVYWKKRDAKQTVHYLNKIADDSYAAALKYELIGDMLVHVKQGKRAIASYEKSLEINSGLRRARAKLIRLYRNVDPERASEEYEKLQYISSFYQEW
jgi:4-amino-4-deoxy-L-arabinose transferase-like glycosyltransferase